MKDKETIKEETQMNSIVLPVKIVGLFCAVATILCIDFIEQVFRYMREEASMLTIVSKLLAAIGWGMIAISVATKLWENYQHTRKNKRNA